MLSPNTAPNLHQTTRCYLPLSTLHQTSIIQHAATCPSQHSTKPPLDNTLLPAPLNTPPNLHQTTRCYTCPSQHSTKAPLENTLLTSPSSMLVFSTYYIARSLSTQGSRLASMLPCIWCCAGVCFYTCVYRCVCTGV